MTTYNTGNPLGSSDPRDLYDNAENLDKSLNSDADSWTDRLGKERPTIAGAIDPTGLAQSAASSAQRSKSEADRSKREADKSERMKNDIISSSAFASSGVFSTASSGVAGTSNNELFWVYPNDANDLENLVLYRNVSDEAVMLFEQFNLNAFMVEEGADWETGL